MGPLSWAHAFAEIPLTTQWLRLYQYEKRSKNSFVSDIQSPYFYFSQEGQADPQAEVREAIKAFKNPDLKYGIHQLPAACSYPARKVVLENMLKEKFPSPRCPDLDSWKKRISASAVHMVFAGVYPGNPASILGHTFLRFSQEGRDDLLSYSVGFLAITEPSDNKLTYMLKGLTGGYFGYYEIEPYYMKVGLYNNLESRDLWSVRLLLSPKEADLLVLHFWELTFNSQTPYYFLNKNCSFRLLKLIEAVKPDVDLTSNLSLAVLPPETVRILMEKNLAASSVEYRASIKRRMDYKISRLNITEKEIRNQALNDSSALAQVNSPEVMDALLEHWIFQAYKNKGKLEPKEKTMMESAYLRASELKERAPVVLDSDILKQYDLSAPFMGHKPKWLDVNAGLREAYGFFGMSYRTGVHPFWSGDKAYEGVSNIEYFGFDIQLPKKGRESWKLLFMEVRSFDSFSWSFLTSIRNDCRLCDDGRGQLQISGGVGSALKRSNLVFYLLGDVDGRVWERDGAQGVLAPGVKFGGKIVFGDLTITAEASQHWWKSKRAFSLNSRINYELGKDRNLYLGNSRSETTSFMLGFVQFL